MKLRHYLTLFTFVTIFPQSAYAYLDPGTGSFLLQLLVAGIMGALYTLKLYWYGFKAFVFNLLGKQIEEPPLSEEEFNDLKK